MSLKLKMFCCEVLKQEALAAIAQSENSIDVEFLPKGLHDVGTAKMNSELQRAIDQVDEELYDYIILGYALCNNGIIGLKSAKIPLVVAKAHDCITLFFGSRKRYEKYFFDNPGVYFHTSGWLDYAENPELESQSVANQMGMGESYEDLVAKYGEDNAEFLYETLCQTTHNYHQFTFIEMGIEADEHFEKKSRKLAAAAEWDFEKVAGDMTLFQRLVDGDWHDDFLIVQPGETIKPTHDENIINAVKNYNC
ncbi:MAG: DUF1638 domain-containing protein [Victivallaceae bacterium]|nr:DUF1638 domain-containing protein [Victivallaceae bacterium]